MTNAETGKPDRIEFIASHQPTLQTGDYRIEVEQAVAFNTEAHSFNSRQHFSVQGPRFTLNPQEVTTVFPPPGSPGDYAAALPHLIFKRSTLPWERSALPSGAQDTPQPVPWLALLLFDEAEFIGQPPEVFEAIKNPKPVPLGEFMSKMNEREPAHPLRMETADQADDAITVIDVPWEVLKTCLPSTKELALLAHVRRTTGKDGQPPVGDESAVVFCNRLPRSGGTHILHLVSVEGRYNSEGFIPPGANAVPLVSLYSWRFTCSEGGATFKGLLQALDSGTLRLPAGQQQGSEPDRSIENYVEMGCVPLPHRMRQGNQTVSWYHGPLIPGSLAAARLPLPAQSADLLVRYDPTTGLFDESYAAAWQLGRLLAIQNRRIAADLFNWKQSHAQSKLEQGQPAAAAKTTVLRSLIQGPAPERAAATLPETVGKWLNDLLLLKSIPFQYLVPEARLLPAESIRFFQVDRSWVNCLLDGAFSMGRVLASDRELDEQLNQFLLEEGETLSGFLLRSDLVAGWPGLLADGYADPQATHRLSLARLECLSKNVLICLFRGDSPVAAVDLYEKPESVHFGVILPEDLKKNLALKNAAEFAFQMFSLKVEKLRFVVKA